MAKGYPRTRFDVIDQTQITEINTTTASDPVAIIMAPYTSDKGTEKWELLYGLQSFIDAKGNISFLKHGQALLSVAEALRNGAYVVGKRMVSEDATIGNITVRARVVVSDEVSYLYVYAISETNIGSFEEACEVGYNDFDEINPYDDDGNLDVPLFTITPMGRGISNLYIRIVPNYVASKSSNYLRYTFEVYEGTDLVESILFTMNPDIIIDDVAQALNPKIKANSRQVQVKLYEDGVYTLVSALAQTANDGTNNYTPDELLDLDFINGFNRRGTEAIGGIVTAADSEDDSDQWTAYMPEDISEYVVALDRTEGIHLVNGTYGEMGDAPVKNDAEYEKLLLNTLGAGTGADDDPFSVPGFDPVIYDLDAYKIDFIFDCNWPVSVKNAIIDLVDFRGDMVFLCDCGTTLSTVSSITEFVNTKLTPSKYCAVYHNYFNIPNPYTKKEITVTMPYELISKLITHMTGGIGRPFAGIANKIYFTDIIDGSINLLPVEIPSVNQKQQLVDANVNYLSLYDGTPVMETMYTNSEDFTQLSYLHNIMNVQYIIKLIRTRCPRTRYTFLDGEDLENYIDDVESLITQYSTYFKSISVEYMADEAYEQNNIFYATLTVQFKNFIHEEYFKIIAIS